MDVGRLVSRAVDASPRSVWSLMRRVLARAKPPLDSQEVDAILLDAMSRYTVDALQGISAKEFEAHIKAQIDLIDSEQEDYSADELSHQRDLSIRFQWGHDHDFGSFKLKGQMSGRHLSLMREFSHRFHLDLRTFQGKDVLDVGCWTGGTTLLLHALGARVFAVEEVRKYARMVEYLAQAFGISDRVEVGARSLYSLNEEPFRDRFDIVYFPGVVYHLTDPVLALRILFNTCRQGGIILVESAGIDDSRAVCRFEGGRVFRGGRAENLTRRGWNWFIPSCSALERMMTEAGFQEVVSGLNPKTSRVFAFGRKLGSMPITRAGLSLPSIP